MAFDIDNIRRRVLIKYPPFGDVMAGLPFIEDNTCYYKGNPTAATDDEAVYYHPDFINRLNENQQVAVFSHEIAHIVYKHIERSVGKNPDAWNTATDAIINANLKKDGLELVPGMIEREDALLYSEEALYEKIYEETKQNKDGEKVEPHASHERWKEALEKGKEVSKSASINKKDSNQEKINANEIFEKARKQRVENLKELKKSLIEKATQQIAGQNSRSRSVSNLNGETKLIDWRRLLENNCKLDKDWSYQNATIEYGVLTPHMEDLPMPETEIILDTSGSINEQLLRNFLRECLGILHQSKVRVGCFDNDFYGFTNIRTKKDIENLSLIGGGGTNFEVAVKAFSKDADNKIIFTDGLANMPKTKVNAIWVVFGNYSISPPGGKVISIREEELRKLNMIDKRENIGKHR